MDKQRILDEIRRTAKDGKPLGRDQFYTETGIKETDWLGKYWARWGDAHIEAGFEPLSFAVKFDDDKVLLSVIDLARKLGKIPTVPEMRMERRNNPQFPNDRVIGRRWSRSELIEILVKYCAKNEEYNDISTLLESIPRAAKTSNTENDLSPQSETNESGYVYVIRAQGAYKIGCTRAPYRRAAEIANQSASGAELLHIISTDDPEGVEKYWHGRFSNKRLSGLNKLSGEWFALTTEDIKAFKRRKFM
ncbi:MAG: GIY-YIG nuclease family protein [Terracidiphilus sp.]